MTNRTIKNGMGSFIKVGAEREFWKWQDKGQTGKKLKTNDNKLDKSWHTKKIYKANGLRTERKNA